VLNAISEHPVQRKPQNIEINHKKKNRRKKHDVADGHQNEAQSPWKNLEGGPMCSRETKLGCVFSFLVNAIIAYSKKVRELGKSIVVFLLFEKLRHSNERSTKFEGLISKNRGGKWQNDISLNITQIESLYGLGRQATNF